jgi:penicillin-binding protein 2
MTTDPTQNRRFYNPRIAVLLLLGLVVLGLFVLRLWDVQIVRGEQFRADADANRLRLESVAAPRGIIYDRTGLPLVRNAPNFQVQIIPAYLPDNVQDERRVFDRLSELLGIPAEAPLVAQNKVQPMGHGAVSVIDGMQFLYDLMSERIDARTKGIKNIVDDVRGILPYAPVTIKDGITRTLALRIAEESFRLPGVRINAATTREYVSGTVTADVLGFMRRISPNDTLPQDIYDADTDRIGAVGVEGQFEDVLRGQKGQRYIEEDVVGREIRVVGEVKPVVPGDNVYLTLDLDLQQFAYQALQDEIDKINANAGRTVTQRGAAIAMNPKTGEILAMVSLPSYDNNLFSRPVIKQSDLDAIANDPYLPQINHAFQSAFPPGSTFKIVPASAALQEGVITPRTIINDPGVIVVPNQFAPDNLALAQKFYGWYRPGFGPQNVVQALQHSVNVFFYEVGGGYPYELNGQTKFEGLGIDRLRTYAEDFGFGTATGIDLIGESNGFVPSSTWKRLFTTENWTLGDTYNMSIGQGYLTATPLQVLNSYAAIANDGVLMVPQVVKQITDADGNVVQKFTPRALRKVPVDSANLQVVRQGLDACVNSDDGTCKAVQVPGLHIVAKTGTAEYCDDMAQKNGDCLYPSRVPSHAWFAAYAPLEDPQIAVVVFIYNGGEGSAVALPVAQKILQHWYEQQQTPPTLTGQLP